MAERPLSDIQRSINFDTAAHRLRSHPDDRVRKAAEAAIRTKKLEGLVAAEAALEAIQGQSSRSLVDVLAGKLPTVAHVARAVRAGRVTVDGKVATGVRDIVRPGAVVEVMSQLKGDKNKVTLKVEVPAT